MINVIFTFLITSLVFITFLISEKFNRLETIIEIQSQKIKLLETAHSLDNVVIKASNINNSFDIQPIINSIPYIICIGGGVFAFWYISSSISGVSLLKFVPSLSSIIHGLNCSSNTEKIISDSSGNVFKLITNNGKIVELFAKIDGSPNFVPYNISEKLVEKALESSIDVSTLAEIVSKINF